VPNIPIDWASVNWAYLILLLLFVFFCALIGNVIAFKRVLLGAVLATFLFAAGFFSGRITRTTCRYRLRRSD
jgi:hypothetical protein